MRTGVNVTAKKVGISSRLPLWTSKEDAAVFSDEDTQLASTLGALAGMAYENARELRLRAASDGLRWFLTSC